METATYLVTIDRPGNITSKVDSIRTILTSTDHIFDRDHVHVVSLHDETYNGWSNRETWAAELHLSSDERLYSCALGLLEVEASATRNGETLEAWVEGQVERQLFPAPGDEPDPWGELWRSMISDVGSFYRVDWAAVAESLADE